MGEVQWILIETDFQISSALTSMPSISLALSLSQGGAGSRKSARKKERVILKSMRLLDYSANFELAMSGRTVN